MSSRLIISTIVTMFLLSIPFTAYGQRGGREVTSKEATITRGVVSAICYLLDGSMGEKHKECAMKCVKKGMPLGILEEVKASKGRG